MTAPMNFLPNMPTIPVPDWSQQKITWTELNSAMHGNPDFDPLTVKGAYVFGLVHDACESITYLLRHPRARETTYISAYGLLASSVELLGRCIKGNSTPDAHGDLKAGFKSLVNLDVNTVLDDYVLIFTSLHGYSITELVDLRNFVAHGQATSRIARSPNEYIDFEILEKFRPLLRDGLERYWNALQRDEHLCNMLASAKILALRGWPVQKSWTLFQGDGRSQPPSITELLDRMSWRV